MLKMKVKVYRRTKWINCLFPLRISAPKPREEKQSTGLGLAIVKRVIEGHKGRIWVQSEVESWINLQLLHCR